MRTSEGEGSNYSEFANEVMNLTVFLFLQDGEQEPRKYK